MSEKNREIADKLLGLFMNSRVSNNDLLLEVERALDAKDEAFDIQVKGHAHTASELAKAKAEIERLNVAISAIADYFDVMNDGPDESDVAQAVSKLRAVALFQKEGGK